MRRNECRQSPNEKIFHDHFISWYTVCSRKKGRFSAATTSVLTIYRAKRIISIRERFFVASVYIYIYIPIFNIYIYIYFYISFLYIVGFVNVHIVKFLMNLHVLIDYKNDCCVFRQMCVCRSIWWLFLGLHFFNLRHPWVTA